MHMLGVTLVQLDRFAEAVPWMERAADLGHDAAANKAGQLALAWVLARPSITAPISSATSLTQLSDLIKSTEVRLRQDSIQLLNEASA